MPSLIFPIRADIYYNGTFLLLKQQLLLGYELDLQFTLLSGILNYLKKEVPSP